MEITKVSYNEDADRTIFHTEEGKFRYPSMENGSLTMMGPYGEDGEQKIVVFDVEPSEIEILRSLMSVVLDSRAGTTEIEASIDIGEATEERKGY